MQLSTLANQLIMQTIIRAILILSMAVFSAGADTLKTAVVTVAGASSVGNTITVNGTTRTAATAPTSFATQFATGSTATLAASNLALAYQLAPAAGVVAQWGGGVTVSLYALPNAGLTVTFGSAWASVSISTQTITNATAVRVPLSVEGLAQQTNIASAIVGAVGSAYNTNVIPTSAPSMALFLPNGGYSGGIGGAYHWIGANYYDGSAGGVIYKYGTMSLMQITNFTGLYGTNSGLFNVSATNLLCYGNPISSVGTGLNSQAFGSNSISGGNGSYAFGGAAYADSSVSVLGSASGVGSIAILGIVDTNAAQAIAIGLFAEASQPYSVAIGQNASTSLAHEIVLGTASEFVSVPGFVYNAALGGTNTIAGDLAIVSKGASLVSGVNFLPTGTNTFQRITGPTGAFSVDQMDNGRDGRIIIIENTTSYVMTIANNSGAVAGGAKIYTGTGAGVAVASSPGIAQLIYDSTLGYWVLMNHN